MDRFPTGDNAATHLPVAKTNGMLADADRSQLPHAWTAERRADGVVIVRIPPRQQTAPPLPDAVFTFRDGDPQFDFWSNQASQQQPLQQ